MSEENEMDNTPGLISWKELMTSDTAASTKFYREMFGWKSEEMDMGAGVYTIFKVGERSIAGMAARSSDSAPSGWINYVTVSDLESSIKKAVDLGARLRKDVTTLQMGRFAIIEDPSGAVVGLWQFA